MKLFVSCIAAVLLASTSALNAEEIKSGLQAGDGIGPFNVTKCAGATEDGVDVGKTLCYRCRNGGRPQVMVFTRSTDPKVVALVKNLDAAVKKHSDKDLRAFVNYLSDSKDAASEQAKKLATESKAENVPFVVPNEFENGPEDYGINTKAEVTVILAAAGKVKANHAFSAAKDMNIDAVVADLSKIVE